MNFLICGTLQRWNGAYGVHKVLENASEKDVVRTLAANDYTATNRVERDGEQLFWYQSGHDNPCRPSIFEIRQIDEENSDELNYMDNLNESVFHSMSAPLTEEQIDAIYSWFDYFCEEEVA